MQPVKGPVRCGAVVAVSPQPSNDLVERKVQTTRWLSDIQDSTFTSDELTWEPESNAAGIDSSPEDNAVPDWTIRHFPLRYAIITAPDNAHRDTFVKQFAMACESRGMSVICFMLPDVPHDDFLTRFDDAVHDMQQYRKSVVRAMKGGQSFQRAVNKTLDGIGVAAGLRGDRKTSRLLLWHVSQKGRKFRKIARSHTTYSILNLHHQSITPGAQQDTPLKPSQIQFQTTTTERLEEQIRIKTRQLREIQENFDRTTLRSANSGLETSDIVCGETDHRPKDEAIENLRKELEVAQADAQGFLQKINTLGEKLHNVSQQLRVQATAAREVTKRQLRLEAQSREQNEVIRTLRAQLTAESALSRTRVAKTKSLGKKLQTTAIQLGERDQQVADLLTDNQQLRNSLLKKYVQLEGSQDKGRTAEQRGTKRSHDSLELEEVFSTY